MYFHFGEVLFIGRILNFCQKQVETAKIKRRVFAVLPVGAGQGSPAFCGLKTGMFYSFKTAVLSSYQGFCRNNYQKRSPPGLQA
ncbi:hypothetical protein BMR02_15220 [Methylococcaceae bacterium HT1]|nr:hypothetical protein BMR02_15220 [Methylococcaceae bacterium HT1]TXL10011.1 hypothetical protein BMR05_16610 [Methylococcaceae bacterium HT4]TXL19384.1 hypothetical protein BMR03_15290 [Methylococcaceae bacterium HT2]